MIVSDTFLNPANSLIESWTLAHVGAVGEDEGLLDVEPEGDDVLGILQRQLLSLLQGEILPQELFIIRHLDHQWNIKYILEYNR